MSALIILAILGSSIWVLVDAGQRDWSGDSFASSPLVWFFGCLFLWIVIFPVYLIRRGRAPRKGDAAVPAANLGTMPPPVVASPAITLKRCPDCAESILTDARVCKHCGFRFGPQEPVTS